MRTLQWPIREQIGDAYEFLCEIGRTEAAQALVSPVYNGEPDPEAVRSAVRNASKEEISIIQEAMGDLFDWIPVAWCARPIPQHKETGALVPRRKKD